MRWKLFTYIVLSLTILVLAVVLYLSLANLSQQARETQARFRDNMTWYAAQVETELLVLLDVLGSYHAANESVTHDDVVERFDIFWSRVEGTQSGKVGELFMGFEGAREAIERAKDALVVLEPDIKSLQREDGAAYQRIRDRLRVLQPKFHKITLESSHAHNLLDTQEYRYIDDAHFTITLIFGGVLAGGSLLVILILFERREVITLQNTLERRVEERTRQLQRENVERHRAEEQLRQAQKMEAVGQLTGGVAHDFNNLLAVIMGNAELLSIKARETDPKIEAVIRAATRGAELTQRLLAFSRKQTLQPQAVEVNALVEGMTDLLSRTLGETIEIKTSPDPGLWLPEVDPGQLENALLNLAINARDAMPEGGTLVIEASNASLDEAYARNHSDVTPGDYVMLAVSDNGSGMSPEVLEHALEPFFTTKDIGEGSGLGLSMVYGFAKQSDGHLAIYSEKGHGTTVKLYLPRAGEEAARASEETVTEAPRARGETVLVVEDDADVRQLAVDLLEDLGYRVLHAPDGWAALSLLAESAPPDLLLSDVVLPRGLSGPDLAEKVKREHPAIKVLFMSGYAEYAARHNGLAGNGAELVNKPFRKQELALKVRAVLDR